MLDVTPVTAHAAEPSNKSDDGGESGNLAVQANVATKTKYFVGGTLKTTVKQVSEAIAKIRLPVDIVQLAPACSFNAFDTPTRRFFE